jgi:hypothetical protein
MIGLSCANIVAPTGGPEDKTPPKVLKCTPPNRSVNFKEKKIEIVFNEYINFSDFKSEVIISPFFKENPDFKLRGKKLIITFKEKLKDSSTYTMFFANSIKDYNEANVLENYEYVFSTGTYVDSLSIKGNVFDAFTHEPQKEVFVTLYNKDYDSVIYKEQPLYITKTNSTGSYMLNNLKPGKYRIYGLKDVNNNYIFDMPNETIAFCDTLVMPHYFPKPIVDTAKKDSTQKKGATKTVVKKDSINKDSTQNKVVNNLTLKNDSTKKDSLTLPEIAYQPQNLYMFEEADTTQKMIKAEANKPGMLRFIFKYPVKEFKLTSIDQSMPDSWLLTEYNKTHDTITGWFNNYFTDSLYVLVKDNQNIIDTARLNPKKVDTAFASKVKNSKALIPNLLYIVSSAAKGTADYHLPLNLRFSHPVKSYDTSKIKIMEFREKDTIGKPIAPLFAFTDTVIKNKMTVNYKFKEKTLYKLHILPGAFTDIFNLKNDTLKQKFTTTELADYGLLFININYLDTLYPQIFQLLDEKSNLLEGRYLLSPQKLKFEYMRPGKYKVRIFQDRSHNRKWDTGNYLKKQQPEKVYYYSGEINVKANWDTEIELKF